MAKINRIRIANVVYDKKIIKDLFLNCYSGENVLLNLANGGGKSVLVQLLQQPLLPESKIHNREIYSYLSPDQPSYILIEWKLDNTPKNYLLTGIVMTRLFSSEDMNKTKYFTFLNEYKSSNEFDIKNIPFIQKDGNTCIYKSYETAMKMLKESQNTTNLSVYGRGEQAAYREKLSEYGIFLNEWKILAKMNENEGGVDELFKDCKTSDSLMNKWILKTISDSNEAESRELKEMFVSLMQEIIEQEANIKEKEILEEFKAKIEEYEEPLKRLLEQLEQEKQVETSIHSIYLNLQKLSKENQEKIEQIVQKIKQGEQELEQINYEEISEEFYHYQSDFEAVKEERQAKQEKLELQKQAYEKATLEYRIQKVAYLHQKEKEANAQIEALVLARDSLENKNSTDEKLIQIEYTLQEEYKNKAKLFHDSLEEIENENAKIKEELIVCKENRKKYQENIEQISNKLGSLEEKIKQFQQEEKVLWEKMNLFLTRNLLGELEEKEVQKVKAELQNEIQQLKNKIEENQTQIKVDEQQIEQQEQKEEQNHEKLQELAQSKVQKEKEYQEFQKQEEKIREILNFHRIKEQNIFEKQFYFHIIQEKQLEYKRKIEELVSQIDKTKEYLLDIEQGGLHNAREIRKMLENAQIEYITGEEYLKKQEEKYQDELLQKNPLLPYCYIVTQDDLEKIKAMEIREEVNKLSPIITYQDIGKKLQSEKQMVKMEEFYFLSLYHKECFSKNSNQYQEKLEQQLENYKKRKEECEKELSRIEEHIRTIEQFWYKEQDKKEMEQGLVSLEREIQTKNEENKQSKEIRAKLQKENKKRAEDIEEKQELLRNKEEEQSKFIEYLEKNVHYCQNGKDKESYQKQRKEMEDKIEQAERQLEDLEKKSKENSAKKNDLTNKLEGLKEKQLKIPQREKQDLLTLSIEELEAQYEQLTKKYEQDRKQIEEQITQWNRRKVEAEKEKQKDYADIKKEDYYLVIYSEEIEDLAKEQKNEAEKNLALVEQEMEQIRTKYTRIETRFQTICDNLKKMGKMEPISASQIKGNYEIRKNKIEEEKEEGKRKQKEYEEQNKIMQKQINEIERNVDVKVLVGEPERNKMEKANLQELIHLYRNLKKQNEQYKKEIFEKQVAISNNYQNKHRIISSFIENISLRNIAEENGYDSYYYVYEKMIDCLEKLTSYIGVLDLSLQNIEQDKKNILQHAVKQGIMLYQELKKISESSKIKIGERYVQILKIEIPQELKEHVEQRIENYLQECIQNLREECKQSEDKTKTIESKVAIYLSDRQLLNLTLDMEIIKVKLYKFDIENKNSALRLWEDVNVGNSGGQKFIACFALISALIEYTRRKELEMLGEEEKIEASKVFILDNPFGKTSSSHLLEPMIEISKKFNIQMICLSDLSQSSITDKFTLIYQLALRSSKYTNNSFLMIEDTRVNGDVAIDTSLEQVYLRSSLEQMSFLN